MGHYVQHPNRAVLRPSTHRDETGTEIILLAVVASSWKPFPHGERKEVKQTSTNTRMSYTTCTATHRIAIRLSTLTPSEHPAHAQGPAHDPANDPLTLTKTVSTILSALLITPHLTTSRSSTPMPLAMPLGPQHQSENSATEPTTATSAITANVNSVKQVAPEVHLDLAVLQMFVISASKSILGTTLAIS